MARGTQGICLRCERQKHVINGTESVACLAIISAGYLMMCLPGSCGFNVACREVVCAEKVAVFMVTVDSVKKVGKSTVTTEVNKLERSLF